MAFDWFRSWHSAPVDPKWLLIARRADVPAGVVSAIAWALLDYASQHKSRGSVDGFDIETYAVYSGWPEDQIAAVLDAMRSKGIITPDERWASWEKRQPKREDPSTDRVRNWRDGQRNKDSVTADDVTQGNAVKRSETQPSEPETQSNATKHGETLDKTQIREDTDKSQTEAAQAPSAGADIPAAPALPASLPEWQSRLKDSKNRPADLVLMFRTLYPAAVDAPDFGYIGKVANKVGGAGRLAELLWQHSAKPPSGDVLAYIQESIKPKPARNGASPQGHNLRELLRLDEDD
jgi:hypothetical protein